MDRVLRTTTILAVVAALCAPAAFAAGNLITNPDFETGTADPRVIPGWDSLNNGIALRAPLVGFNQSNGALLVGHAAIQSASLFLVTPGETLTFSGRVWEMRDDTDGRQSIGGGVVRGDSVVAIEFVKPNGASAGGERQWHCDAYVDLLDNDRLDESDTCTVRDEYVTMTIPDPAISCSGWECDMYDAPIVVPAGASHARVLLGGGLAGDFLPVTGLGLNSDAQIVVFDDLFLGN